ncbi:beta-glucosidase [Listeria weihenstephanensis FSL R9-0317]|uniref:beta-glucosidase n=1 Tax=Listeria weihenstephanensis TaxID=1006155 RepID=A0A1S7FXG5_9LIST|nr:glycoside hydrolase family 3 N-terminal domain-containing protein [Listeria weihenstephanensis]AQY52118.1 glycosyl hydrolase family 3 [Listeria weihenstephanensis]EUJ37673.1 beta-glucosidase [Listeria weihenstephanensis FSL R9-0317]
MKKKELGQLLGRMTVAEKVGQLLQLAPMFYKGTITKGEITGPMAEMGITAEISERAGSVLGSATAIEMIAIQEAYLETNRLGIPLIFMADVVHGYKTIFPIPLAIGATWDVEAAEKMAAVSAKEATAAGLQVTFSPMVDLVRDPRWGRVMESTGEDPHLNSEFAASFVRGYQGDPELLSENYEKMAACVKHFAAYGAAEAGREYNTVDMSTRELYQNYLPAYVAALEAGSKLVMTAFNVVDGVPATGNEWLMRDVLRDELGFDGVLISDWGAVKEIINHGTAADSAEAAEQALRAGVDIEMMTTCYLENLEGMIADGTADVALVDEAVMRILELKNDVGLFEDPYRGLKGKQDRQTDILSAEHRDSAREIAADAMVLLKNVDGLLPLAVDTKIALVGPLAKTQDVLGAWSWLGDKEDAISVHDGMAKQFTQVDVAGAADTENVTEAEIAEMVRVAKDADVIVLALGESADRSGEANSIATIRLPETQYAMIEAIRAVGKPVVTVLFNGRPLDLHGLIEASDALVEAWFPGTEAGNAVADILAGRVNPNGKLPMSFPYTTGQIPVYYNHLNTGRPVDAADAQEHYVSQYIDIPNQPLFDFGFGLSYTTFAYTDLKISSDIITKSDTLTISVTVTNTGEVAGKEVVALYLQDLVGKVSRPRKELKRFSKIDLAPGEARVVTFCLTEEDLRYYKPNLDFTSDPGDFKLFIGADLEATFCLV